VLQPDRLRSSLDRWRAHKLPRSRQLMTLFVLESWLRGPQLTASEEYRGVSLD